MKYTIKIDGLSFETESEQMAQAFSKYEAQVATQRAELEKKVSDALAQRDGLQGKLDAAAETIKNKDKEISELPTKLAKDAKGRADLESRAAKVLGAKVKLDGLKDKEIRVKVLSKLVGDEKAKEAADKSDAYLEARSDAAMEEFEDDGARSDRGAAVARGGGKATKKVAARSDDVDHEGDDGDDGAEDAPREDQGEEGTPDAADRAYEQMRKDNAQQWKKTLKQHNVS